MAKRNLLTIATEIAIGIPVCVGIAELTKLTHEWSQKISGPGMQEYIGKIGSNIVEYGLPAIYAVSMAMLGIEALMAYDKWQLEKRSKAQP